MQKRKIERDGKMIPQYLRVCKECGDESWKYLGNNISTMCASCRNIFIKTNDSTVSKEELLEDEVKNQAMIAAFLKKKKPSVTFKDQKTDFKAYTSNSFSFPKIATNEIVDFEIKFPIALKAVRKERNKIVRQELNKIKQELGEVA